MTALYVGSEVGQLRRVILSRPERALTHLTPSNCHDLLFDDVVDVEQAAQEHDIFSKTLQEQDVEVLLLHDLLTETLTIPIAKQWLLETQISDYRYGPSFALALREYLQQVPTNQLSHYLLGGLSFAELPFSNSSMLLHTDAKQEFVIEPLPNHLFTRDTSCWMYNSVSLNPMKKSARRRETHHLRAIYRWHPLFANQSFERHFDDEYQCYDNAYVEGGDVLVLGNQSVVVGLSERTTPQGVENLAKFLFESKQVKQVIALELPKMRACMHLDTVLTQINQNTFSIYPEIISENIAAWRLTPTKGPAGIQATPVKRYQDALCCALNVDSLNLISTGGNRYQAQREQWNDANNLLALKPNLVVSYEHNQLTNEKYDKAGVEVLTIPGKELGRGRGGARCMSCPIERDGI